MDLHEVLFGASLRVVQSQGSTASRLRSVVYQDTNLDQRYATRDEELHVQDAQQLRQNGALPNGRHKMTYHNKLRCRRSDRGSDFAFTPSMRGWPLPASVLLNKVSAGMLSSLTWPGPC